MSEVEIGMGKSARPTFGLDELAILPSRRTRHVNDVDISWEIDAYKFDVPLLSSPIDGVTSPATAIEFGKLGGVGVLNLEGLWTRYEDPQPLLDELAEMDDEAANAKLREVYKEPIKGELIIERIRQMRDAGVIAAGSLAPQRVNEFAKEIARAEPDLFVIRGTVVSAEHVSKASEPLNLKRFIREFEIPTIVGGCASYKAALHLMRTGAVGVLVGVGSSESSVTRRVLGLGSGQATAIADARGARMRHLDETGVYVQVIADSGVHTGADIAKAIVCGADAVMVGAPLAAANNAPGRGSNWSDAVAHPTLPRGSRIPIAPRGTLQEILFGPATGVDGRTNLCGALKMAMAMSGYQSVKEFQKAELVINGTGATHG